MQANEFEKKVQETMDEFKLRPSEDVWQNVERRIREKKKKRRILFIILFSFIGLALGGYGVYNFAGKQTISKTGTNLNDKISNSKNSTSEETTIPQSKSSASNESKIEEKKNYNKNQSGRSIVSAKRKAPKPKDIFTSEVNGANKNEFVRLNKNDDKNPSADTANAIADKNISGFKPPALKDEQDQKTETDSLKKDFALNNYVDSGSIKKSEDNSNPGNPIAGKEKTKKQYSHKLQWGIDFSAGSSVITEDPFSFKGSNSQSDRLYSSPNSYPGSGGPTTQYPPSANKPVFAFKVGAVVKKPISSRSVMSIGLQYAHLGDAIKAATTQTQPATQSSFSNFSSYYSAVPQKAHTDRFHFIELPIIYSWRINKDKKHFVSLNAGASFGYLVASNALIYDTSFGGIYFHDKSLLTKTHFNLMSGLSYHFATNKFDWSLGPHFSFDVSKAIKTDLDKRKYILFGGIDTRIFFEKKKR